MPDLEVQTPAAEPVDAPPEAPEESASPEPSDDRDSAVMNALLRGQLAGQGSASNRGADGDGADDGDAADGEPAQSRDAKPNDQPGGRRSRRAAEAEARIAELQAERDQLAARVAEMAPPPPDASEEARKAILESEARFRRLLAKPDDDPDWTHEDYQWLQDEKRKRAAVPELRQHYDTVLEQDRAALRDSFESERVAFWNAVTADMASGAELPGVDLDALKAAPNFAARDRLIYQAALATRDDEVKRLRNELADARRHLLGEVRPPLNGGRSTAGATYDENAFMNSLIRGGRA